ncbi:uncharacterized protein LOC125224915 [Leguminivora glycinivorella]|uniref:uncharacterized protein LOC125224915 n=1 Tax=Leguminivora glycinivorella TaxID=1035111 RepID=UPI00200C7868|nr:uncharacterized protein LOC125224915 [Leguminivora glycinivorella]
MLRSRILGLRRVIFAVPQVAVPRLTPVRTYKIKQPCDAHMNELPIPCGPWQPWYDAKQSFYNKILIGGVLWFLFSFAMMIMTDSIYLHFAPPSHPGPPSDMVQDCEDE